MDSTVSVGTTVGMNVEVGGTGVKAGSTVGVVAGVPHPTKNNIRNARPIIGNTFLLSILVSILYWDKIQQPNETVE